MIVSNPIRVMVEIEDKQTGCTYIYQGANVNDCTRYFQSMFFGKREYRFVHTNIIKEGE